jgi:hypothetical protein
MVPSGHAGHEDHADLGDHEAHMVHMVHNVPWGHKVHMVHNVPWDHTVRKDLGDTCVCLNRIFSDNHYFHIPIIHHFRLCNHRHNLLEMLCSTLVLFEVLLEFELWIDKIDKGKEMIANVVMVAADGL